MAKKKTTAHRTPPAEHAQPSTKDRRRVPTYATDAEIKSARLAHGADYERLIASGAIVAPTFEELPADVLDARIAKKEKKAEKAEPAAE